jgi:tartrate-resistant acid phosphatase type 5
LWYDFFKIDSADQTVVHFIVVDTMSFILRKHDSERQLAWLEEVLQRSPADWIIMIGHNPPYSAGGHAPGTVTMRNILVPICDKYGVDIFFNGDEHNLEHISSANVTDYVISGGGGRGLYEFSPAGERVLNEWGFTVDYFGYHFGFVAMEMTKTAMTVEFVDTELNVRYSFTRNK